MSELIKVKDLPFNRGYFWSYDWENGKLPLEVIVEQVLIYGELEDIFTLFSLFDSEQIKGIYYSKIRDKLITSNKSFVTQDKALAKLLDIIFETQCG